MTAPSQAVQAKAATYLLEGRVRVTYASGRSFRAQVRGSAGYLYYVTRLPGAVVGEPLEWHCDCPASTVCAHITACQAIWQPSAPTAGESAERGRRTLARISARDEESW